MAVEDFTHDLTRLLISDTLAPEEVDNALTLRLRSHQTIISFHRFYIMISNIINFLYTYYHFFNVIFLKNKSRWKLDIYYQLRAQEINGRVEKCFQLLSSPTGIERGPYDKFYESNRLTIETTELSHLAKSLAINEFHLTTFRVLCTELSTCLHKRVMPPAQASRFFGLSIQLVLKLMAAVNNLITSGAVAVAVTTSAAVTPANPATTGTNVPNTPGKAPGNSNPVTANYPGSTPGTATTVSSSVSISNQDLTLLTADLYSFSEWMKSLFLNYSEKQLSYNVMPNTASPVKQTHSYFIDLRYMRM